MPNHQTKILLVAFSLKSLPTHHTVYNFEGDLSSASGICVCSSVNKHVCMAELSYSLDFYIILLLFFLRSPYNIRSTSFVLLFQDPLFFFPPKIFLRIFLSRTSSSVFIIFVGSPRLSAVCYCWLYYCLVYQYRCITDDKSTANF